MTPLYFDAGGVSCFAWLHAAASDAGPGLPVLLCGGMGAEDLSSHAFQRDLAQRLSAQGQPCLRFDWPGVGDSAALPADADVVQHGLAAVQAACDALRAATGAPRIAVLGLRLGAALAVQALVSRDDIAAIVACVPVVQGRALLREWRMLGAGGVASVAHDDGSLETGGFHFNAATCGSIDRLRLDDPVVAPPAGARLLVIDRDDLPVAQRWCGALQAAGVPVERRALPGFDGLMAAPHLVVPPQAMADAMVQWLRQVPVTPVASSGPVAHQVSQCSETGVTERPLWLDDGAPPLFALCCEPASAAQGPLSGTAVLLLNTGAERRIGPHGQFVALARHWAARGAVVWRLDLAGIGDSPAHAGALPGRVYPVTAMADVRRALACLRARPGVRRVAVLGLCSGAYHAFEAAVQGLDLDLAVAINPLVFARPLTEDFDAVPAQAHAVQQLSGEALRNLRDPARWAKLLRGDVNLRFIATTLARRAGLAGLRAWLALRRALGWPAADDLAARLRAAALTTAPTPQPRLCFVFAEHDPGLALLRGEAGRTLALLQRQGRVYIDTIAGADHTFSRTASRRELVAALDAVLGRLT